MPQRTTVNFSAMLPSSGILPYYVSEARKLTRAPVIYHLASFLTCMGALLDPVSCCYLIRGEQKARSERLFLWMLLVGKTGNKKTTAAEMALKVFENHLKKRTRSPEGGRKGLEDMLLAEPYPVVKMREAGAWFANNRMAWSGDGATFWTQCYDGSYMPRNIADPKYVPEEIKVGVTILGMGPQKEIQRATRASDWEGGLGPRLCFCKADPIKQGPGGFDWPTPVLELLQRGVDRTKSIAESSRYFVVSKEARELWDLWDARHTRKLEQASELHAQMGSRLSWHVLRIAAIIAASRFSTVVERKDVFAACNFGVWLRRSAMSMEPGY